METGKTFKQTNNKTERGNSICFQCLRYFNLVQCTILPGAENICSTYQWNELGV